MNYQDLGVCRNCGAPNKLSKAGKPYCSALCFKDQPGYQPKPQYQNPTRPVIKEEQNWQQIRNEKKDNINRAVALKAAVELAKGSITIDEQTIIKVAETFLKWLDMEIPFE